MPKVHLALFMLPVVPSEQDVVLPWAWVVIKRFELPSLSVAKRRRLKVISSPYHIRLEV